MEPKLWLRIVKKIKTKSEVSRREFKNYVADDTSFSEIDVDR